MKTLIVGTGVIGVIYGWALAEAGVDVTHFVRPGKSALYKNGVDLDVLDERKGHRPNQMAHYAMRCVEDICPADGYELIIAPVNAFQLGGVLETLAPRSGEALFLTLTSNWEGAGVLDACLPRERYLMGYADGGGTIRDGLYWVNLGAEIHLGLLDGQDPDQLLRVRSLFEQAGMKPDVQPNILHWLWVHNASAIGFSAGFARYKDFKRYMKDDQLLKTSLHATRELLALCEKRGVNLKDYPDISYMGWPDWLVLGIMRWMFATNKSMQRFTAHGASEGSLNETKMHYKAMMQSAEQTGLDVPALSQLGTYLI